MADRIQVRRDTEADWTSENPTLQQGELGWVSDTNELVVGNGSDGFTSLPRIDIGAHVDVSGDTMTGPLLLPAGTAAEPALSFSGDADTGIYRIASGYIGLASNGSQMLACYGTAASQPRVDPGAHATYDLGASGARWKNLHLSGQALLPDGSTAAPAFSFSNDTDTGMTLSLPGGVPILRFVIGGSYQLSLRTDSGNERFYPGSDGVVDLGFSTAKWNDIHASNGTIQTSDEAIKDEVADTALGLDFVRAVRPVDFKFKGGTRTHVGFSAQQIADTLDTLGIGDRAAYVDPAVAAEGREQAGPPKRDDGESKDDHQERVKQWRDEVAAEKAAPKGLRYSELIAPLYRAVQQQQEIIDDLVARVEALEGA